MQNYTKDNCEDKAEDSIENNTFNAVHSWDSIATRLTTSMVNAYIDKIAPHYVYEERIVEHGKMPQMKEAVKCAEQSKMEEAKSLWESVLSIESAEAKKDRVHALANLALYYEISEDFDKSMGLFRKCFELTGDSKYLDSQKNIEKRIQETKKLKHQL